MCMRRHDVATEKGIAEAIHKLAIVVPFACLATAHSSSVNVNLKYISYISYLHIEICNGSDIAHH